MSETRTHGPRMHGLVIHMQGYLIPGRHFLGQYGTAVPLNLCEVSVTVDNSVKMHAIVLEQSADVFLGSEGGGVDPYIITE